jgi:hypothetical protein
MIIGARPQNESTRRVVKRRLPAGTSVAKGTGVDSVTRDVSGNGHPPSIASCPCVRVLASLLFLLGS